jgi:hypothetical protein
MTCPNCRHVYPISAGIPNMVRGHAAVVFEVTIDDEPDSYLLSMRFSPT